MNTAYALTTPGGTGQADIEIDTVAENQFLGCDQKHACSLVIVPAQGGNVLTSPPNCADHSQDNVVRDRPARTSARPYNACSWADRIVVPLSFAPTPSVCKLQERRVLRRGLADAGPGHGLLGGAPVPRVTSG